MNRDFLTRILAATAMLVGTCTIGCDERPATTTVSSATVQQHEPLANPETLVSTQRLMASIAALPTKRAALGDRAHVDGLYETQRQLIAALHEMGLEPTLQKLNYAGGLHTPERSLYNIIVDLPGEAGGEVREEVVMFSAHVDAVVGAPGADDDGTGVAAILEMARLLKDRPMQRTLRLVLFNLEEVGIVGSMQYATALQEAMKAGEHTDLWRGEQIVGMVSMDMLGYYSDAPNSQRSPVKGVPGFRPPTVADFIGTATLLKHRPFSQALKQAMHEAEPACKVVALDVLPIVPPDLLRSDHAPFLAMGVPAVIMSDTAELRSRHYHTPSDTIETIDQQRYTLSVRAVVGAAWRLCGPAEEAGLREWLVKENTPVNIQSP